MVESSDTDKPTRDSVCTTCGKAVGAAVSGSDGTWSFKPVCRCSSSKIEKTDDQPKSDATTKTDENSDEAVKPDLFKEEEDKEADDSVFVKTASSSEVDSGGWASVTSAKTANGPDLPKRQKSSTSDSGSWKGTTSPKSFKDNLSSGDSHESWISLGSGDFSGEAAQVTHPPTDDFSGPVPEDFNRPVVHEIGKMSSSGATASSASSSGTNLGVTYSSGTNLSGASGAYRRGKGSSKTIEEPVDWVPVKSKPPEKSKSQFADDAELLDLTHKTETAEEKVAKPDTRKAIQDALRRNRIKTFIVAVIFLVLSYGVYQYATTKGLIKKLGILSQTSNSNQQSKKGSGRHSKKNKRTK